jgi:autotransporter-associated beta strand protein
LGVANAAGRRITVGTGAILSFTSNNIYGNGSGNANLPTTAINGGTLTSTRYNVLGNVELNGGTLTQSASDSGGYQGYQFRGSVAVGGSAASSIETGNGKGNHLGANTVFTVADATGNSGADLTVSTPLLNQSADFGSAAGGLTKEGAGTMRLAPASVSTYTGATVVNGGSVPLEAVATVRWRGTVSEVPVKLAPGARQPLPLRLALPLHCGPVVKCHVRGPAAALAAS